MQSNDEGMVDDPLARSPSQIAMTDGNAERERIENQDVG